MDHANNKDCSYCQRGKFNVVAQQLIVVKYGLGIVCEVDIPFLWVVVGLLVFGQTT